MVVIYILTSIFATIWLITISILGLILCYQNQKPIGKETILDFLIIDLLSINILGITFWNFLLLLSYFWDNLDYDLALFLTILARLYFIVLIAASQAYIGLKGILIFHGQEIQDFEDSVIKKYSRRFIIGYTLMMILVDQTMLNPNNPILFILTDSENEP